MNLEIARLLAMFVGGSEGLYLLGVVDGMNASKLSKTNEQSTQNK